MGLLDDLLRVASPCRLVGLLLSAGSVGDCYDNAMCESFFATLETELLDRSVFRTRGQARREVFDFIEGWYNPHRRHTSLGYLSPVAYEMTYLEAGGTQGPEGYASGRDREIITETFDRPKTSGITGTWYRYMETQP